MVERRGTRRRVVLRALMALTVLIAGITGAVSWRLSVYDRGIERMTEAMPEETGRPHEDPGENWLLVGSDMRGEPTGGKRAPGEAHADASCCSTYPRAGGTPTSSQFRGTPTCRSPAMTTTRSAPPSRRAGRGY
ncbi:hypothetical protein [Allosalinactinospora lopnorensis]|uniref:hypothetical protein n=1 Tax=Allosalinactinospora lopnorensis TaxID=1352348 RepID=UPI001F24242F|nr:hypothetical protein [Allosalinactinospora lopnorensis]